MIDRRRADAQADFQPLYRLRPYQGATFDIRELEGSRVEFRRGPDGRIHDLVFRQPNGIYIAKPVGSGD